MTEPDTMWRDWKERNQLEIDLHWQYCREKYKIKSWRINTIGRDIDINNKNESKKRVDQFVKVKTRLHQTHNYREKRKKIRFFFLSTWQFFKNRLKDLLYILIPLQQIVNAAFWIIQYVFCVQKLLWYIISSSKQFNTNSAGIGNLDLWMKYCSQSNENFNYHFIK